MDPARLKGKRAIITGAASGIGRAAAIHFSQEGARIGVVDVSEQGAGEMATAIKAAGGEALTLIADVTQQDQMEKAVNLAVKAWGGLDIVVAAEIRVLREFNQFKTNGIPYQEGHRCTCDLNRLFRKVRPELPGRKSSANPGEPAERLPRQEHSTS